MKIYLSPVPAEGRQICGVSCSSKDIHLIPSYLSKNHRHLKNKEKNKEKNRQTKTRRKKKSLPGLDLATPNSKLHPVYLDHTTHGTCTRDSVHVTQCAQTWMMTTPQICPCAGNPKLPQAVPFSTIYVVWAKNTNIWKNGEYKTTTHRKPGKSSYPPPPKKKKRAHATHSTLHGSRPNLDDCDRTTFPCRPLQRSCERCANEEIWGKNYQKLINLSLHVRFPSGNCLGECRMNEKKIIPIWYNKIIRRGADMRCCWSEENTKYAAQVEIEIVFTEWYCSRWSPHKSENNPDEKKKLERTPRVIQCVHAWHTQQQRTRVAHGTQRTRDTRHGVRPNFDGNLTRNMPAAQLPRNVWRCMYQIPVYDSVLTAGYRVCTKISANADNMRTFFALHFWSSQRTAVVTACMHGTWYVHLYSV